MKTGVAEAAVFPIESKDAAIYESSSVIAAGCRPAAAAAADTVAVSAADRTIQEWILVSMAIDSCMHSRALVSSIGPILMQLIGRIKSLKDQVEPLLLYDQHQGSDFQQRISQFQWDDQGCQQSLQHCRSQWSLQGCRSSCSHIPELLPQLESECEYQINHSFASLQSNNWGLGTAEEVLLMPDSQDWFGENHVTLCLRPLTIVRNDVYFLHCFALDSILKGGECSQSFYIEAQKMKPSYVACLFSPQQDPKLPRNFVSSNRQRNDGYHWVGLLADLSKDEGWIYDPMNVEPIYDEEFRAFQKFVGILKGQSNFALRRTKCPFSTKCQTGSDGVHCGAWCSMFMIAWCLGPEVLHSYESDCKEKSSIRNGLLDLALQFRGRLCTDIVRHDLLDVTFLHFGWKSPTAQNRTNDFWINSPLHICAQLQIKYGSRFTEVVPLKKGHWEANQRVNCGTKICVKNPMFFRDGIRIVKVHRFLWGKINPDFLALALHEVAATAHVCPIQEWNFEVFGLFTTGVCASYVYLCICRDELESEFIDPAEAGRAIVDLFHKTGVAHGDGWVRNVLMVKRSKERHQVIDFERSFIPNPDCDPAAVRDISLKYAKADIKQRADLVKDIARQGLQRTRTNFITMANQILSGEINLFDRDIDDFIRVFQLCS